LLALSHSRETPRIVPASHRRTPRVAAQGLRAARGHEHCRRLRVTAGQTRKRKNVMKRSNLLLTCLALAVVSMLGLARPAAAGAQVPFKGSFEGQSVQTPAPPFVHDEITATGHATHLGRMDMVISATVDPVARTGVGTVTFLAANGDTLTATTTGVSTPTSTPGVISIVEQATITGGTGRFAGASGTFTIERLFDRATGAVTGTIEGSISR
jgi:hypothetical protein